MDIKRQVLVHWSKLWCALRSVLIYYFSIFVLRSVLEYVLISVLIYVLKYVLIFVLISTN